MKIDELMAGDWVLIDEPDDFHGHYGKVVSINAETNYVIVSIPFMHLHDVLVDDLRPIPLTEEILKKNKWECDGVYCRVNLGDSKWLEYYSHEHRLRYWYRGVDEWDNHKEKSEIISQNHCLFVHELQHALKLCKIEIGIGL